MLLCAFKTSSCVIFLLPLMLFSVLFPDCIGLNPPTYSSAPGNSDYKNFTLKFYKSDDIMIVLHHLKGQFSFSFLFRADFSVSLFSSPG